jgi:putative membrane protein insertion efficiency factor
MIFLKLFKKFFLFLIRAYQLAISPLLGHCCRFYPSCSHYCHEAIEKYGVFRGLSMSIKRIAKCGPWHKGGVDLP